MIKPKAGSFNRNETAPEWQWFWDRRSLCILFDEASTKPLALVDGVYKDIITVTEGTTGGTSTAKLDAGNTGIRADFTGADGAGGGEWAYHIADSDLPDWFPGKDGGKPSNEFTCLLLAEPAVIDAANAHIVLQKDTTTNSPIFIFFRETIRCNLEGGSGTALSNGQLTVGKEEVTGCVFDGINQYVIQDSRWGVGVSMTAVDTNTGPLNIGTRTSTVDTVNARLNGSISGIIFIDTALEGGFLNQFEVNFFGPFRTSPPTSFFELQTDSGDNDSSVVSNIVTDVVSNVVTPV